MSDSGAAVITGIITTLKADAGVIALVSDRVFTDVPQDSIFPYMVVEMGSSPYTAKDFSDFSYTITVKGFSNENGVLEALNIKGAAFTALDRNETGVSVSGFDVVRLEHTGFDTLFLEDDGAVHQSAIDFEMVVQQP